MLLSRHATITGVISLLASCAVAEPPRYTATDVTGWSDAELATLPFFQRAVVPMPSGNGVPFGFVPVVRSASGRVLGTVDQSTPYAGSKTALLSADGSSGYTAALVDAFGVYSWGYWSCDSTDCHYYFGYVRDSSPRDMNWAGAVVGSATISGSGDYSTGASYHAFLYSQANGIVDLFPNADSSWAHCINNRGAIAGTMYGASAPVAGAFRRHADGTLQQLDVLNGRTVQPRWINDAGVIVGGVYPSRAFVSPGGSVTSELPNLGGFDVTAAVDLNDLGWITGYCGDFGNAETYATIWEPGAGGTWTAWDLVEQVDTPDVLLERAIAIDNSGHILALGHEDGTDLFASRMYLLTPDQPLDGWCRPIIGGHPEDVTISSGDAVLSVDVANASDVTGYQWRRNGVAISVADNPTATDRILLLESVSADVAGAYDCVVTSACGTSTSLLAQVVYSPSCAADVATPFGVLDIDDVLAFLDAFSLGDPAADLAPAFGILDIDDVLLFLSVFAGGCP